MKIEIRQTRTHHQVRPKPGQQFGNCPVQFGPFVGSVIGLRICISTWNLCYVPFAWLAGQQTAVAASCMMGLDAFLRNSKVLGENETYQIPDKQVQRFLR